MEALFKFILILLILINGVAIIHFQACTFSSVDPKFLFWLVPWGPSNGTYTSLLPYLPHIVIGIVFAFNTYSLGDKNVTLKQALSYKCNCYWISTQISKLKTVYNRSSLVFINFFLTTDHWRGCIESITPAQVVLLNYTLHKIAGITNGGEKLVLGLSEMNKLNNCGYLKAYSLIQQVLPNAELFYYTDLGQTVCSIESVFEYLQSNDITLNYLGYSVYPYPSYNYVNGVVSIPSNYVSQILELKCFANQRSVNFFIGEVGFRDGDVKGYICPSSTTYIEFNSTVGYNDTIHYYEDVISQLESMGINLIGEWNYNGARGDHFGLWDNPDFDALLEYVGIKPIETATIDVISNFPYYYVNGSLYYANRTYTVVLPANITFVRLEYLNNTARVLLVSVNGTDLSNIIIKKEGDYEITATYMTQYYVSVCPQVVAYINGVREEFVSGWYNISTRVTVPPQVIQVGQGEIYNITKAYTYVIDSPLVIKVPFVLEYYVRLNVSSVPAIINGTNSTLVSSYYIQGSRIEIPEYFYLNQTSRLSISASPQEFVVSSPIDVKVSEILQWLVKVVLPNGTVEGWYDNGSIIFLPKVIEVDGTTYVLNESSNEVVVTGPLVLYPHYVICKKTSTSSSSSTSQTCTTTSTKTETSTSTTVISTTTTTETTTITIVNNTTETIIHTTTPQSTTSSGSSSFTRILALVLVLVILIIIIVIIISKRR